MVTITALLKPLMQGKMPGGYRKVIAIEQDFLPSIIRLVVRLFAYVKGCGKFHKSGAFCMKNTSLPPVLS